MFAYLPLRRKSLDFGKYAHTVGTLIVNCGHKESWSYISSALQTNLDYEVDWKISGWGNLEHRLFFSSSGRLRNEKGAKMKKVNSSRL